MDKEIKQMFELILTKLDNMDKRQEGMDKRQDEIFEVVKSIEHSNTVHKAEIDNLAYKVAHVEGIINAIGELIQNKRLIK